MSSGTLTEPNYEAIVRELRHGRVVPVIGSGASGGVENCPLNTRGLRELLLAEMGFANSKLTDLADIASLAEGPDSQINLRPRLNDLFQGDFDIPETHKWLASLDHPVTVISTNYDRLLEKAFDQAGRRYHLVAYCGDLAENGNSVLWKRPDEDTAKLVPARTFKWAPESEWLIFKIHGTAMPHGERGTFVITHEDYTDVILRLGAATVVPKAIIGHLRSRSLLFLGHGLNDIDLEVLRRSLTHQHMCNWAVYLPSKTPCKTDRELTRRIWLSRGVHLHWMKLEVFLERLRRAYAEL
ncbi:MAG: SIR2 family protein [Bryobacteraceae bacterium]|jgi:hypothetical protein